ncbi:MAG: hypothetical protein QXI12_07770 [Candidatus Methanomethyliaceae archaeon]
MNALTFQVLAEQPLLIGQPGAGEENSATSYDFIPGSVLRGLLINRYLNKHQWTDILEDQKGGELFFSGNVIYLNAYPGNRLNQRTLPKPLSWFVDKDQRHEPTATVYDFALLPREETEGLVSLPGEFCWYTEDGYVEIIDPLRRLTVHNASDDRNVKGKGNSSVYRYDAIAPGQSFSAAIVSDREDHLRDLRELLEMAETAHVGGSRSAGYGLVSFQNIALTNSWHEYTSNPNTYDDLVVITLLSDTILRDPISGQFTTNLDDVLRWTHQRAYFRTRIVGGFNRKWGLPLVQAPALQAGSTYVYKADEVDFQTLARLTDKGIGERLLDGFGRIAINWHNQEELKLRQRPSVAKSAFIKLSPTSERLLKQMTERSLRLFLDKRLLEVLGSLRIDNLPAISNAQLSRLRLVVLHALRENNPALITNHLAGLKKARIQFERARIDNQRLITWLQKVADNDSVWQTYLEPHELEVPSIAGFRAQITHHIKIEYTMRFLDALLKRAIKEKQSGGAA